MSGGVRRPELTIFYNTRCPICDAGIDWQRNRLLVPVRTGRIAFRDINLEPEVLSGFGIGIDDVRRRLHALDGEGRLVVGVDVAVALWRVTPRQGWLARLFGHRLALPLARFGYDRFADLLFSWNKRRGRW